MNEYSPNEENSESHKSSTEESFLIRLKHLIFGSKRPDIYTLSTFFVNLFIGFVFFLWEILSVIAITSRELIWQQKGVSVEAIINDRGEQLGFTHGKFIEYLTTVHSIGLICWGIFLIGLIFLYRKKEFFIYFTVGPLVFYAGMLIFYLNFTYFLEDTTGFDKVVLLISLLSLLLHYFLLRSERLNGSINFFGLDQDEESETTGE